MFKVCSRSSFDASINLRLLALVLLSLLLLSFAFFSKNAKTLKNLWVCSLHDYLVLKVRFGLWSFILKSLYLSRLFISSNLLPFRIKRPFLRGEMHHNTTNSFLSTVLVIFS